MLAPPLKGLILQTFGTGNAPDQNLDFLRALKEASDRGVVIVNITQCPMGTVESSYATGIALLEAGVVPGHDMTIEAATTKLGCLLRRGLAPDEVRQQMRTSWKGELTEVSNSLQFNLGSVEFVRSVYNTLAMPGFPKDESVRLQDQSFVQGALYPVLMCSAAALGSTDEILSMVQGGASVNCKDSNGRTPLHIAASAGQVRVVKLLVELRADCNVSDTSKESPLESAIQKNHENVVDILMASGAKILSHEHKHLIDCIDRKDSEQLRLWIRGGATVNTVGRDGRSSLHVASLLGCKPAVKILLDAKADPNKIDSLGYSPLWYAVTNNHKEIAKDLVVSNAVLNVAKSKLSDLLCEYVQSGDVDRISLLLSAGCPVNAGNFDGRTALHIAACNGDRTITTLLRQYGADSHAKDRWGNTPLSEAAKYNHYDLVNILSLPTVAGASKL